MKIYREAARDRKNRQVRQGRKEIERTRLEEGAVVSCPATHCYLSTLRYARQAPDKSVVRCPWWVVNPPVPSPSADSSKRIMTLSVLGTTMGRAERECGQMGVMVRTSRLGTTMGPPVARW